MSNSEFAAYDAFERHDSGFVVTTTAFEGFVTVAEESDTATYTVEVTVPTLDSATKGDMGPTVQTDWFETFERRLADAPGATRKTVDLDELQVREDGDEVVVRYVFTRVGSSADIAKTFAEYVEGTYVEGVIPGYEYTGQVAQLLGEASQGGDGGTPL
jgi:hypothetical protein